jgi:hypothetical protein
MASDRNNNILIDFQIAYCNTEELRIAGKGTVLYKNALCISEVPVIQQ